MERVILHCDMNNYFASVELLDKPEYRNKPVVVCGNPKERHGIILAKNELAKQYGIKTAMPLWQALKLCKDLILLKPHYEKYHLYAKLAHKIYLDFSNQVEPYGLDEAWIDVTGSLKLFGSPLKIASMIKARIQNELGLTVSIGISFNKIYAKLASDFKDPSGIFVISKNNYQSIVYPLEIDKMIGIGKKMLPKLNRKGIYKLGDFKEYGKLRIFYELGKVGEKIYDDALGFNNDEVVSYDKAISIKSISRGTTTVSDMICDEDIWRVIFKLANLISKELINQKLAANRIGIMLRDNNLKRYSFRAPLVNSSISAIEIAKAAMKLFKEKIDYDYYFRSIAIVVSDLSNNLYYTNNLFEENLDHEDNIKIEKTLYDLRNKYGDIIGYAGLKLEDKTPSVKQGSLLPRKR